MIIIYRISDQSYQVPRLPNATKEHCFINFLNNFLINDIDSLYILADSVGDSLFEFLKSNSPAHTKLFKVESGSNGACFRLQLRIAAEVPDGEIIFFHEDDYLYRPNKLDSQHFKFNNFLIGEGLKRAHYVSLYDHPDKYLLPGLGGESRVSFLGAEMTEIFLTTGSHWKYTDSTTLTFGVYSQTLRQDLAVWHTYAAGDHPDDFQAFLTLRKLGRKIATPIPGLATHADPVFCSPFTDWSKV